jgi:hypothetical protein
MRARLARVQADTAGALLAKDASALTNGSEWMVSAIRKLAASGAPGTVVEAYTWRAVEEIPFVQGPVVGRKGCYRQLFICHVELDQIIGPYWIMDNMESNPRSTPRCRQAPQECNSSS